MGLAFGGVRIDITIFIIAIIIAIYFIPAIIARKKKHTQTTAITLLNIFLGWTFIGWVVALIWAVMKEKTSN